MEVHKSSEKRRLGGHGSEDAFAKASSFGKQQKKTAKLSGPTSQLRVCSGVKVQIVARHGLGKDWRLAECEVQALAGDGVHAAGSITNERNISADHAAKRMRGGD